jgi:hypothetical protein
MTQYDTLKQLVAEAEEDILKAEGGNRAAGTRVRKQMMKIRETAQEIRKAILESRDQTSGGEAPAQA